MIRQAKLVGLHSVKVHVVCEGLEMKEKQDEEGELICLTQDLPRFTPDAVKRKVREHSVWRDVTGIRLSLPS